MGMLDRVQEVEVNTFERGRRGGEQHAGFLDDDKTGED